MKKILLSLSAAVACMSMSAAVPALTDQFNGSFNVVPEEPNYSNPSAYDANGNLIITGKFKNEFTFNNVEVFGEGVNNAYIVKYNADNTPAWAASLAGPATIVGVDTDADGNIYVGGVFAGKVDFLSGTADGEPSISKEGLKIDGMPTDNMSASFIAKYDKDGKILAVSSYVPEMLPFLAEKAKDFLYSPTGPDLYFNITGIKVEGEKVYATVEYTGQTAVGDGTFDGAYTDLFGFIYMDAQNVGAMSMDCATLNASEIVAKMELVGPFADGTPALKSPAIAINGNDVIAGFVLSASESVNDVKIKMGSFEKTIAPKNGEVEFILFNNGTVSSIKKAKAETNDHDMIEDLIINNGVLYLVGTATATIPALEISENAAQTTGRTDIFVASFDASTLSLNSTNAYANNEGTTMEAGSDNIPTERANYEIVSSTGIIDGALYINTKVYSDFSWKFLNMGSSYWFDGSAFSAAPVAATGIAVGNGVAALVSSDATKVDYKTYTFTPTQSGISGIEADFDENAPVEYFNLQGIRVANPENGLYIRRQGNKVEKVIL